MPLHPAWVKNISRRVLWAALESDISNSDRDAMAAYFGHKCAYCDGKLPPRWHADHLLPVNRGGYNHISNRVPACPSCNEKEKGEKPWRKYLEKKCGDNEELLLQRTHRIESWRKKQRFKTPPVTKEQRQVWKEQVDKLSQAIDDAWNCLKNEGIGDE